MASARALETSASRRSVRSPRRQTRVGPASRVGASRTSAAGVLVEQAVGLAGDPVARLAVDPHAIDRRVRARELADELRVGAARELRQQRTGPALLGLGQARARPVEQRHQVARGGVDRVRRAERAVGRACRTRAGSGSPRSSAGDADGAGVGASGTRSIRTPSIPSQRSTALRAEGPRRRRRPRARASPAERRAPGAGAGNAPRTLAAPPRSARGHARPRRARAATRRDSSARRVSSSLTAPPPAARARATPAT